ncbi:hypothetical protein L3X38_041737 [Prunus dulcis]|uniref:Uncharacterized protein n=1 Tax=Prunus dulcis TaxID=3755 RepID=A0AAD4YKX7_PRUDU|nr:hypothetical protein L3X38_041737 [Prunus dulcis]
MESVSHAGTSNAASETENLFFPHAGTSNAACGKSNNWGSLFHAPPQAPAEPSPVSPSLGGGDGSAATGKLRFKLVELVAGVRGFRWGKLAVFLAAVGSSATAVSLSQASANEGLSILKK